MKYRDDDIILVKSDNIYKFKELIPSTDHYLYMKILSNGKILICKGGLLKSIFKLKGIEKLNIYDIKIDFFNDYIYSLLDIVKRETSAYQFNFQYKNEIILYSCSIYPCLVYDECKSFDVIIRKNSERDSFKDKFFTEL